MAKKSTSNNNEWEMMKSGVLKHCEGIWFANQYCTGWYFYTRSFDNNLGPFSSFEAGFKEWNNNNIK